MEDSILEKIKKLIKKQESAQEVGSTEEAEAFSLKIQELLNKHNLSKSEIKLDDEKEEDKLTDDYTMTVKIKGIGGMSNYDIMSVICDHNWCAAYWLGTLKNNKMHIVGTVENIEICKYLH